MKRHSFITRLASLAVVCGLTLAFASCANEDLAQNNKTTTDDKGLTAFCTGEPATRTTMEEMVNSIGKQAIRFGLRTIAAIGSKVATRQQARQLLLSS